MPRSNGSTGSTTAACWSRSATCRRPKLKRSTTGSWRSPPQSPPDSNETASEEVGTVQTGDHLGRRSEIARVAEVKGGILDRLVDQARTRTKLIGRRRTGTSDQSECRDLASAYW